MTANRIIIDTDPGTDDALAIFLALNSPELKIEALTAVAGNVPLELTLPNALRLLEVAKRTDIPVAAGADHPLARHLVTAAYAHGENGLGGIQFPEPVTQAVAETATAPPPRPALADLGAKNAFVPAAGAAPERTVPDVLADAAGRKGLFPAAISRPPLSSTCMWILRLPKSCFDPACP